MRIVAAYFIFSSSAAITDKIRLANQYNEINFLDLKKEAATNRAAVRVRIYLSFLSQRVITKMART